MPSQYRVKPIKAQEQIVDLLKRVTSVRAALAVTFRQDPGIYPSAIVEVNDSQRYVRLDEVLDASAHHRIKLGLGFRVEARLGGVFIHFFASDASYLKNQQGQGIYQIRLPKQVFYSQKRSQNRVALAGSAFSISARIGPGYQGLTGIISDLSFGGVGILTRDRTQIGVGQLLERVRLELRSQVLEVPEAKVIFLQKHPQQGLLHIGCRFVNLPQATREEIRAAVIASNQNIS